MKYRVVSTVYPSLTGLLGTVVLASAMATLAAIAITLGFGDVMPFPPRWGKPILAAGVGAVVLAVAGLYLMMIGRTFRHVIETAEDDTATN